MNESEPLPEGFEPVLWQASMRCIACRKSISGIGYTLQQLADKHKALCKPLLVGSFPRCGDATAALHD